MTPVDAQSKRIEQVEPELRKRWHLVCQVYRARHPHEPQPYVVSTYRDAHDQQAKVDEGKSDAPPGHSLHNYLPCPALDYGFKGPGLALLYEDRLFRLIFPILIDHGLACGAWIKGKAGGLWHDKGHTHAEGYTWQQASVGRVPRWKPLPASAPAIAPKATP